MRKKVISLNLNSVSTIFVHRNPPALLLHLRGLNICQRDTRGWVGPQHLNFKKGKQCEKTFSLSHYLIEIGQQQIKRRNQYYCLRPSQKIRKIATHETRKPSRSSPFLVMKRLQFELGINIKFEKLLLHQSRKRIFSKSIVFRGALIISPLLHPFTKILNGLITFVAHYLSSRIR